LISITHRHLLLAELLRLHLLYLYLVVVVTSRRLAPSHHLVVALGEGLSRLVNLVQFLFTVRRHAGKSLVAICWLDLLVTSLVRQMVGNGFKHSPTRLPSVLLNHARELEGVVTLGSRLLLDYWLKRTILIWLALLVPLFIGYCLVRAIFHLCVLSCFLFIRFCYYSVK